MTKSNDHMLPEILTFEEALKLLGISETVAHDRRRGRGGAFPPVFRLGGKLLMLRTHIDEHLARHGIDARADLLPVEDAAAQLRISMRSLATAVRRKQLPDVISRGSFQFFNRRELVAYVMRMPKAAARDTRRSPAEAQA